MEKEIKERILSLRDDENADFCARLVPHLPRESVLGIKIPLLRRLAAEYKKTDISGFLNALPHEYLDENNFHAIYISGVKDFGECMELVERFLPFVDNWMTCDTLIPKVFAKNKSALLEKIPGWLAADQTSRAYTVRFGTGALMRWFSGDDFDVRYVEMAASVISEEYYINMMTAWYFATALAKHYEETLPFIEQRRLGKWTHNKAIQKAVESYRVTDERKAYLKTLKIK